MLSIKNEQILQLSKYFLENSLTAEDVENLMNSIYEN